MADIELKIQILRKSIGTFTSWLDSCDQLLTGLPAELENCQPTTLRELALKYKDLLLQMKERCSYIHEVNSLCKQIGDETSESKDQSSPQSSHNPQLAELATEVRDLNTRFANTCVQAKQHYTDLSKTLTSKSKSSGEGVSPILSGTLPAHLPPRRDKAAKLRKRSKGKRKHTESLYVAEEEDGSHDPGTNSAEVLESGQSPMKRSHSVPTDLDELMSRGSRKVASQGGGVSNTRQQTSGNVPSSARKFSLTVVNSDGFETISINSNKATAGRPMLGHSESLDSPSRGAHHLDFSPFGSLRGSRRRPKSAAIVSGEEAQFCYLDDQGTPVSDQSLIDSPVLKVSPGLVPKATTNQILRGKPIVHKVESTSSEGQRSSRRGSSNLSLMDGFSPSPIMESTNQNASILSNGSSLLGSNLGVEEWGREGVSSDGRRSKSMDELASIPSNGASKDGDLTSRLRNLSVQLKQFVHSIAESRRCALQSLALELHMGEVKAMLTILEVQDIELTRLRATFSPLAKRRVEEMESLKTISNTTAYPKEQVANKKDEILKLSDRVGMLRRHCAESVEQTEEVLELVVQYERQFKALKDFLHSHASKVEVIKSKIKDHPDDSWRELSEELTTVSEEKSQLKCIHELSVHLLYLEPIFDGSQVRDDLKGLADKFQQLTLEIFGLLEEQAKLCTEALLMESSVMSSWITEASLSVQALAKKAKKPLPSKNKLADTRDTLTQELRTRQSSLDTISDKLHPLLAVLNPDETPILDELVRQVETNRKSLKQIEINLSEINITSSRDNLLINSPEAGIPRSLTVSGGMKRVIPAHGRSFSDVGVNEQIKQLQSGGGINSPSRVKDQSEDPYAEISSLQAQILSRRLNGESSRLAPQELNGTQGQRSSMFERMELPSPLVEFDHAPSRPLDNAIERLPQSLGTSPAPSLPHTPLHLTPTHPTPSPHPNGKVVQYTEIEVSTERQPVISTDQSKSGSAGSLDHLQSQDSHDSTYAEIDKEGKKIPAYAEINKFRKSKTGYAEIRKVTSSPDIRGRGTSNYAEIEVKNLSQLVSDDKYAEIDVRDEPEEASDERVKMKMVGSLRKRNRHMSLHEELLEFIGEEWADLSLKKTPHQAALDEAALDQSLSGIGNMELRSKCQRFVRGVREVGAGVQGVMEQISVLKPPESPDLERVHSAIDQCQKLLDRLNKLHPRLSMYNSDSINLIGSLSRTPLSARVSQLIEIRLFEVSTLWYSANLKASTHMRELRSQEGDINYLYRQLQKLSRVIKEGSTLLSEKDTITNVGEYLIRCKVMYGKMSDLSDLRKQVSSDIKETVSQITQTANTKELVDQMKEVNSQWKTVTRQLQKMPILEPLLIQLSLSNISSELETMETTFSTLEERVLRVDEAATKCSNCKAQLERARLLNSSLSSIKLKLSDILSQQSDAAPSADQSEETVPPPQQSASGPSNSQSEETKEQKKESGQTATGDGEDQKDQTSALLQRCEQLRERTEQIMTRTENLSAELQDESDLIVEFHSELNDLQLWMSDTLSMLQLSGVAGPTSVAQLRGKHQAIFQQIVTRQSKLNAVRSLAEKLVELPANSAEKQLIDSQLNDTCNLWDNLCKQIVPAGSLPQVMTPVTTSGRRLQFEPPSEFEDIQQMIDWLSMIEFRLQPKPIIVGDVKQIRRCLQDLQMIASEVRSRDGDYNRFFDQEAVPTSLRQDSLSLDFDPELPSSIRSILGVATPDGVYQVPPKFVKFYDESTLERHHRRKEITQGNGPGTENGSSGMESGAKAGASNHGEGTLLDGSLTRYHSEGPEAGQKNEGETKSRSGMELKLDGSLEPRPVRRMLSDMNAEEELSLTSLSSQILEAMSPQEEEVYQLHLLWRGVWASLNAQKKRLESTLEVWRNFEEKKEEFCDFLTKAEDRIGSFFKTLSECKTLTVVQTEISAQQELFKQSSTYSQRLATLSQLSEDLITGRHSNDDTSDLKDMMADLNDRWSKVVESVSQHQPTVAALATRWAEFFREYQSLLKWIQNLDVDMSNLNPFVSNLSAVKIQLDKMKEIQQELGSREGGGVESVRLLAYKLLQGVGGCHIDSTAIHSCLDNLGRRVGHLETLAQERRTALEQALTEKQDFLSNLADALAWLSQAEKHLTTQKPLGTDYDTVHSQYEAHQTFWKEVLEQQPKVKSVIAVGNRLANDTHWKQGARENLQEQFRGVPSRWERVWCEGEEWGQLLEGVYPEMETFQSLCSECGQKLSDSELIANKMEPVSRKLPVLEKQLQALDIFETNLVAIGSQLEAILLSQRKQVQLGVKVTADLYQLVKRFHQRWNQLKQCADERRVSIQKAQIQYDPANLSTTELPAGWKRVATDTGTPYFINTRIRGHTQWEHPDLSALHSALHSLHSLPSYPSPAYSVALKLQAIQQKTQLALVRAKNCINVYTAHASDPAHKSLTANHELSFYDMTVLTIDLFQTVEEDFEKGEGAVAKGNQFHINRAVEMTTCWIRDVFDIDHQGKVGCMPMMVAAVSLSRGKLEEKYKTLFKLISRGSSSIDLDQVTVFLEHMMLLGQSVSDSPFCSLHAVDVCARECFRKYVGVGRLHLPQFISWLQTEPPPMSWLPILHRLGASEHAQHDVRCSVCKTQPIVGFRYRCVQCTSFDMCQSCYWAGKTGKGHDRTKHSMEEYCVPKPADEVKDFLKTIRRSLRRKKNAPINNQPHPPQSKLGASKVGVAESTSSGTPVERRWTAVGKSSPSTNKRHTAYVPISLGEHCRPGGSREGGSLHPGRRFTVLEDTHSSWRMSAKEEKLRRTSSPPTSTAHPGTSWRHGSSRPPPASDVKHTELEESLSRITQTSRSLSFRLRSLREKHTSPGPREGSPEQEEATDRGDGGCSPTPEDELRRRNAMLQGRVQLLQEHNLRLENCISQLKVIATLQQSSRQSRLRPLPSQPKSHLSPRPPPLPSRAIPTDTYDVPPSHGNSETYDVPPSHDTLYDIPPNMPADYEVPPNLNNSAQLYSVPVATRRTSSPAEIYSVPKSNQNVSTSELYSVPTGARKTSSPEVYSVPPSRGITRSPELYSVPPSRGKSSPQLYSVPPSNRRTATPTELYDVPPTKNNVSKHPSSISPRPPVLRGSQGGLNQRNGQGGLETYSIPPPRLLSAQPNPEIPPPRLPRRINTAPSSGTSKSSSFL